MLLQDISQGINSKWLNLWSRVSARPLMLLGTQNIHFDSRKTFFFFFYNQRVSQVWNVEVDGQPAGFVLRCV